MPTHRLVHEESILEYVVFNENSSNSLICFHGFGQNASLFYPLAQKYKHLRIISINMFFHGKSQWISKKPLSIRQWKGVMDTLITRESLEIFDVAGYSLGGRFALSTYKLYPNFITSLYLIAPDGLVRNPWFHYATSSKIRRGFFYFFMHTGNWSPLLLKFLGKTGIINQRSAMFATSQIKNNYSRHLIFKCWQCFFKLKMSPSELTTLVSNNSTRALVILSKVDPIIDHRKVIKAFEASSRITVNTSSLSHVQLSEFDFLSQHLNPLKN